MGRPTEFGWRVTGRWCVLTWKWGTCREASFEMERTGRI